MERWVLLQKGLARGDMGGVARRNLPFSAFVIRGVPETAPLPRDSLHGSDVVSRPRPPLSDRASQNRMSLVATAI